MSSSMFSRSAIVLGVIAIIIAGISLAQIYTLSGEISSLRSEISSLTSDLSVTNEKMNGVENNIEIIAEATGVPLENPEELEKILLLRQWEEGAKKEGKLVVYAPTDREVLTPMIEAFQMKYPFLTVEHYEASADDVMARFTEESRLGQHYADAISAAIDKAVLFKREGYSAPWEVQKIVDTEKWNYIPPIFRDPEGYYWPEYLAAIAIVYNTDLVTPEEAPKNWNDLLDPKWKGQIVIQDGRRLGAYSLVVLGIVLPILGQDYFENLAQQGPFIWETSATTVIRKVGAGEGKIGLWGSVAKVEGFKLDEVPVEWVKSEPLAIQTECLMLSANAPHPNAAKLWLAFYFSAEGQSILGSTNLYFPAMEGIPFSSEIQKLPFPDYDPTKIDWEGVGVTFGEIFFGE